MKVMLDNNLVSMAAYCGLKTSWIDALEIPQELLQRSLELDTPSIGQPEEKQ